MFGHRTPAIAFVLLGVIGHLASAQNDSAAGRITTATFSVEPPQGKGWVWAMRPDSTGVEIRKHKGGIPGLPGLSTPEETTILVAVDSTTSENAARGADSVAKDFIDQEEAQLRAQTMGSFAREVTLNRAERRTDSIGAYKVYVFEAQVRAADFSGTVQEDQELFLYFPPDLKDRHEFFVFHMSRVRPNKHGWDKNGFKALRQVVESFRDRRDL